MVKNYEYVEMVKTGSGGPDGDGEYTVSWYEWVDGQGRDCGLNRESTHLSRTEARELATELRAVCQITGRAE